MRNVVHITWTVGTRPIGDWTIFPWVMTDVEGFEFTWLFMVAGYLRDEHTDG